MSATASQATNAGRATMRCARASVGELSRSPKILVISWRRGGEGQERGKGERRVGWWAAVRQYSQILEIHERHHPITRLMSAIALPGLLL
jgi:hypothetical protein